MMKGSFKLNMIQSPYQMIRTLINFSYRDNDVANMLFDFVVGRNVTGSSQQVMCLDWKYEWAPSTDSEPILKALSRISKVLFNILSLPDSEPTKQNLLTYVRNTKQAITTSLCKHLCRNPPLSMELKECQVMSKNDVLMFCDHINQFELKATQSDNDIM